MHDDLCTAIARTQFSSGVLHCWLPPHPPFTDHLDRDFNVYWRPAPKASESSKRRPLFRRNRPEGGTLVGVGR